MKAYGAFPVPSDAAMRDFGTLTLGHMTMCGEVLLLAAGAIPFGYT